MGEIMILNKETGDDIGQRSRISMKLRSGKDKPWRGGGINVEKIKYESKKYYINNINYRMIKKIGSCGGSQNAIGVKVLRGN